MPSTRRPGGYSTTSMPPLWVLSLPVAVHPLPLIRPLGFSYLHGKKELECTCTSARKS